MPVKMTLNDREGDELRFERHGRRRPAVVVPATFTLGRLAVSLELEPCHRVEAEGLEGDCCFVLGVGDRKRGEELYGMGLVGVDQHGLSEIQVDRPRGMTGSLQSKSQGRGTIVEA